MQLRNDFRGLIPSAALLPRGRRASIAVLGAGVIAMLAALTAVAVDLGSAYLTKVASQRTADSAAYAGALAYNASSSTTTMGGAVTDLVVLNGLTASAAATSLVASPSGNGNNAVRVKLTTNAPLYLARVFHSGSTMAVSATSYAEVRPNAPACIIALQSGGSGVTLSGGTAVTAANCAVASNATVSVPCGTTITTKTLDYNSSTLPSQPCTGIKPPTGTATVNVVKVVTPNPLSGNAAVATAFANLTTVAGQTGPSGPSVSGGLALDFGYGNSPIQPPRSVLTAAGCSGIFGSSTWTVTCPAGGTYNFASVTMSGGISLNFASGVNAQPTNTYNFNGAINIGGSAASFGPGTYNIGGGVYTGGGTTTTFGAGTHTIGNGTVSCGGSFYSICNTGTSLTFGPGGYSVAGGISNGGGATLKIGEGSSTNSFTIGAGSAGYAINAGGGSTTFFGDVTNGTFRTVGKLSSAGGSTLTISAAPAHDLNGLVNLAGTAILGSGVYTVAGNVALGAGGGGGTVTGSAVSIITSGTFTVSAGYSNVTLTAPASGALQGLVVAGNGVGGASFSEGASGNSLSGVFYFPSGPITLSGAGNVGGGAGQCLELIGSTITLSGGSALASTCSGLGGSSSGGTVVLVQ